MFKIAEYFERNPKSRLLLVTAPVAVGIILLFQFGLLSAAQLLLK